MANQLTKNRHWCSELVSLFKVSKKGEKNAIAGNLEEIAPNSAIILAEQSIPVGTRLRISCRSKDLEGIALSCRRHKALGFFLKVRLTRKSEWSLKDFTPMHLFSLRDVYKHRPRLGYDT